MPLAQLWRMEHDVLQDLLRMESVPFLALAPVLSIWPEVFLPDNPSENTWENNRENLENLYEFATQCC